MTDNERIGALLGMNALLMAVTRTLLEAGVLDASGAKEALCADPSGKPCPRGRIRTRARLIASSTAASSGPWSM